MNTALLSALAAVLGGLAWQSAATMCALPLLALLWSAARGRRAAAAVVACYYLAGASVLPETWAAFFGEEASPSTGFALWIASACLLALPWAACWPPRTAGPVRIGVSMLLALIAVSVPPLGIFGWLNPLLSAASLFPGARGFGLAATWLLMVGLAASVRWWPWQPGARRAVAGTGALMLVAALLAAPPVAAAPAPAGWRTLDTELGRTPDDYAATIARQVALIGLVRQAIDASGTPIAVLILPEQVAGRWTEAQQAVWQRLTGASGAGDGWPSIVLGASVEGESAGLLRNAVLVDPAAARVVASSRQPVPFSMWRPGFGPGYDADWVGTGVSGLRAQRVLWSICYDDFLVWPFLLSFALDRPTVIVSLANSGWARSTRQQRLQAMHVHAWGRLFDVPVLRAVNRTAAR